MGPACPPARTFYRLRRELVEVLSVDRRDVRPSTRLDDLIPAHKRRAVWKHLRRQGLSLSDLCFTGQIRCGPITVGEAVLYLTRFQEYPSHRWSRTEIATKVRLIISESLGVHLEEVKPESRLVEDLGCC